MPAETRGSVFPTKDGYGIRWPEDGKRPQRTGFRTKTQARQWFTANVEPRLARGTPSGEITFDAFCDLFLERHGATVSPRTKQTLDERLRSALKAFGTWRLSELEGSVDDVARWRASLSDSSRYRLTLAFRQALAAAVRWRYMVTNPVVDAGRNPQPRTEELLPFTREEIDAIAEELGGWGETIGEDGYGPLVVFAAETGLRTNEWIALERRDLDKAGSAVAVQRRASDGVVTPYPKTERSRRRVPLTSRALAALSALPARLDTPLVFPAPRGGRLLLDNWRTREWYDALDAAGISKRGPYHLRHTFASEALAAGVSIFELSRVMGASVKEIDRTYGHLVRDSEEAIRSRLEARGTASDKGASAK
jgi:integrase